VLAMLCIVTAREVARVEADMIVVSLDRLTTTVRGAAEIMQCGVYRQADGPFRDRRSHRVASRG
jgi:hypothetical protein